MTKRFAILMMFVGFLQFAGAEVGPESLFRTDGVPLAVDYCVGIAVFLVGAICLGLITKPSDLSARTDSELREDIDKKKDRIIEELRKTTEIQTEHIDILKAHIEFLKQTLNEVDPTNDAT